MARKTFFVPAAISGFIAIVLLVLTVVSMPTTYHKSTPFEIVRASNLNGVIDLTPGANDAVGLTNAKFGIWGYCTQAQGSNRYASCTHNLRNTYTATFAPSSSLISASLETAKVKTGYTRGLVVAAVALVMAVIAFFVSLIPSLAVELISSVLYLLATLITLAAFIVQIVFFVYIRVEIRKVTSNAHVSPGPAFYFTLISIPLLFFSSLTVCCGWRKGRQEGGDIYNKSEF